MKIVSLFSGAGGLDLGLRQSGLDVLWANDIDSDAVSTYRHNIGNHIVHADIANIDITSIPDADVVVGGFPCQGFSQANMKREVGDDRNVLYKFFLETIKIKQPKFFIAENVKGILSLSGGEVIRRIIFDFCGAGFSVAYKILNMADYGVPQTRQRVIIVGQHYSLGERWIFQFPTATHSKNGCGTDKWVSIKEAIEHFPCPDSPNDILNHVYSQYKMNFRNFTGHRRTDPERPCPTILARGNGKGGVCAIPHYNGLRRLTIRESASVQTFPEDFAFFGKMNSCYRQIGNAVPVHFAKILGGELIKAGERVQCA